MERRIKAIKWLEKRKAGKGVIIDASTTSSLSEALRCQFALKPVNSDAVWQLQRLRQPGMTEGEPQGSLRVARGY